MYVCVQVFPMLGHYCHMSCLFLALWTQEDCFSHLQAHCIRNTLYNQHNMNYYSFKIFPHFWLVKTTHIIHHNQLLFTKLARYRWLNQWCQKCSPLQIIEPMTEKTWGQDCVIFGEQKTKREMAKLLKNGEILWMNNKAITEFGFRRILRILQISEGIIHLGLQPLWIAPSLICRILHILLSLIQQLLIIITVIAIFVSRARILPTRHLCVIIIYQMSWYSLLEQICITILCMSVAVSFSRTRYLVRNNNVFLIC